MSVSKRWFVVGNAGTEKRNLPPEGLAKRRLTILHRQLQRAPGGLRRIKEAADLGISGGQRTKHFHVRPSRNCIGSLGQGNGAGAISKRGVGARRQHPSQITKNNGRV